MTKKYKNGVLLAGKAAETVTGSNMLVVYKEHKLLLECGLYQSSNIMEAYRINTAKFAYNPKEISAIIVGHAHIDHSGLIPRLYKEGCRARIIVTRIIGYIMKLLWDNSCYLLNKEASRLSKQTGKVYEPVYTKEDVDLAWSFVDFYDDYDQIYTLDRDLKFQWLRNGHCLGASQVQLILGNNGDTKKIFYTSDIGALNPDNHFVNKTEIPDFYNHITIMETTHGDPLSATNRKRKKEVEIMKGIIETAVNERHGSVVMPVFAFAKLQELMVTLYETFHDDPTWKTKIYVDTMLGVDVCKEYLKQLQGEDLELWKKVMTWDKMVLVREYEDSEALLRDDHSKVVLSASGFGSNGRVVNHLKKIVKDDKNAIIVTGYPGSDNTYLTRRLLNEKNSNKITIEGVTYPYRSSIHVMKTFSSHMDYKELVQYAGSVRTDKLVFVHGDMDNKLKLAPVVVEERSKNNINTNLIIGKQGMFIEL